MKNKKKQKQNEKKMKRFLRKKLKKKTLKKFKKKKKKICDHSVWHERCHCIYSKKKIYDKVSAYYKLCKCWLPLSNLAFSFSFPRSFTPPLTLYP